MRIKTLENGWEISGWQKTMFNSEDKVFWNWKQVLCFLTEILDDVPTDIDYTLPYQEMPHNCISKEAFITIHKECFSCSFYRCEKFKTIIFKTSGELIRAVDNFWTHDRFEYIASDLLKTAQTNT